MRSFMSLPLVALFFSPAAWAQTSAEQDRHAQPADDEIVVTAQLGRTQADLLSGTSIVAGDELTRAMRPALGEMLAAQPGVSATSFGPNASRPVLRGLQGDRVRVLTDGIGSFDVSTTSVDHAVAINPLIADRVEVLRGPAALMFGSSAIGGVVNVIDSRIPRRVPDHAVHVDVLATYGSAADEKTISGRLDVPLGGRLVAHIDGSRTRARDLRIGGFVLAPALRALAAAGDEDEITELATLRGRLPNTASKGHEFAGGLAWLGERFSIGASVSRLESLYGVPIRFAVTEDEHEEEEDHDAESAARQFGLAEEEEGHHHANEPVRLDMRQTRYDMRAEYAPASGFLDAVKLRAGAARYRHDELEEDGGIGTSFFSRGGEARLDLIQRERNGWTGLTGAQVLRKRINIIGAEKFLPRALTTQSGIFTLQSFDLGSTRIEGGARLERTRLRADADADLGNPALRRSVTALSGSLGANHEFAGGWRAGLQFSHAERAPSAEELFSNGPHAGTQAFEIGDPLLRKERSTGVELTLHADLDRFHFGGSLYANRFSRFIYETATGAEEDELPVFVFRQAPARQWGFEADARVDLLKRDGLTVSVDGIADYTRVTLKLPGANESAPRIPSLRFLGGIAAQTPRFDVRAEVERVTGQERVAAFETATPGYTMVNLSATVRPMGEDKGLSLLFSLNNLFNVNARRHASFLKDYSPLAGRDFRASIRFEY